jgi:hypothetical protein
MPLSALQAQEGPRQPSGIIAMMRFIIALGIAIVVVVMAWPYLRRYTPRRQSGAANAAPKPATKGELIYFAILTTVALTFAISTMLWVFGK